MASLSPVIVWLRNDLRLDDHEPLHRAVQSGAPVAIVYCIDPRQFGRLPSDVPKTGAFRAQFLLESLTSLRDECRRLGGDLVVRQGMPETVLPALARELGAIRVLYHEEVASEETTVEAEVDEARAIARANAASLAQPCRRRDPNAGIARTRRACRRCSRAILASRWRARRDGTTRALRLVGRSIARLQGHAQRHAGCR
jgi:deoxyribodipyrimidine photolyase